MSTQLAMFDDLPVWPSQAADAAGFPRLAAAVRMGRALRARGQRLRAGWLTAAATARSWRAPGTPAERAQQAASVAARLLAITGTDVDRVGVVPDRPAIVVANSDDPRLLQALLAGGPAFVVSAAPVLPSWLAGRLGNHVLTDDDGAATRHALVALRAGLPLITTRTLARRLDVITLARMVRVPIIPALARVSPGRATAVRIVVCPALYPLAGGVDAAAVARHLADGPTATSRSADSW